MTNNQKSMMTIKYQKLNHANPDDLLSLLNKHKLREHLVEHVLFDSNSLMDWINAKIDVDAINGCKVRAINYNDQLAGWCGIQLEDSNYELAIVIDEQFWGLGRAVFQDMMGWAKELGHNDVFIHFLHTRPDYKFLHKIAKSVFETEMLGSKFTTYQLAVN